MYIMIVLVKKWKKKKVEEMEWRDSMEVFSKKDKKGETLKKRKQKYKRMGDIEIEDEGKYLDLQ